MTVSALVPARLWKEIRSLSPAWLACLASMIVAAGLGGRSQALGLAGYFLGAVALGGLSMGHEYSSRTLTLFLAQPARRERLFVEKLGVLMVMLLSLSAVARLGLFDPVAWDQAALSANWWVVALLLPVLCGLFIAPWLTMVCRSALAGIVFALAIPGMVWVASDFISGTTYGGELSALAEASDFTFEMFWRVMLIVSVLAAVSSWRIFMRLEAIDSRGLELHLPSWLTRQAGPLATTSVLTTRHALWLLAAKELRLQHLTFAVSGLYVVGWLGFWLYAVPQHQIILLSTLTALHAWAIALIAGSLPSAEERQLGTLEWQVLLPMSAWKQWAVKAGIAVSVAMVLALGLPAAMSYLAAPEIRGELRPFYSPTIALAVFAATVSSLYVSSLSANGLKALLVSLPAVILVMGFATRLVVNPIYGRMGIELVLRPARYYQGLFGTREYVLWAVLRAFLVLIYLGVLGLLLRFAMTNHRSAERGTTRVWTQLSWMTGSVMVGSLLWYGGFTFYVDGVNQRIQAMNRQWAATRATATFVIEDGGNAVAPNAVVIVFPDVSHEGRAPGAPRPYYVIRADRAGRFSNGYVRPGVRYSAAAVARLAGSAASLEVDLQRDPALRERLEKSATAMTLHEGESATIKLKLTHLP